MGSRDFLCFHSDRDDRVISLNFVLNDIRRMHFKKGWQKIAKN